MAPVLTDAELAELLQLDPPLVDRLVEETDLPRIQIAEHRRFITHEVLAWLSTQPPLLQTQGEAEGATDTSPDARSSFSEADTIVLSPDEDAPFVSKLALSSLGHHAADPGHNLMRQQVRDGVAALGDALHPTLVQLSGDRLHPSPRAADRTSAWRLEDGMECIDHIMMAWAEGAGPPGFADRPRLALSVTADAVEFSVQVPESWDGASPNDEVLKRARAAGAMVARSANTSAWSVTYLYDVARGAPTVTSLEARLARDARTLVPLWASAFKGDVSA